MFNLWCWFARSVMSNSCEPMHYSLPGSFVHGILQARILECVAISFSSVWFMLYSKMTQLYTYIFFIFFSIMIFVQAIEYSSLWYTVKSESDSHSVMSDSMQPPWTIAHQAFLSMEFSRQEYWSGLPCLPPGDLPDSGIKPRFPALQADSLPSEPPGKHSRILKIFFF